MDSPSLAEIKRHAASGDKAAMTALAKRFLLGQGGAPRDAAPLLSSAAAKGSGEAAGIIAVLIAIGARTAPDWTPALKYLQQSAEAEWPEAQSQLRFLAQDRELAAAAERADAPPDIWGRLRRNIEIENWIAPAQNRMHSERPHIRIFERFFSAAECRWMIERARPRIVPARVYDRATARSSLDPARSNSAAAFDIVETDVVLLLLRARIAASVVISPPFLEETNILHYEVGQEFRRHFDFLDPAEGDMPREIAAKGQRISTFLVYLNDEFDGAETEFPAIDWRFKGAQGDALFFRNVDASGAPDRSTLHAGLAPTRGEKWLLSQWIRDRLPQPDR